MQGMDYVYAVWQEKSFSAAARKLFVSQPALSASVRKVERELGLPIFRIGVGERREDLKDFDALAFCRQLVGEED